MIYLFEVRREGLHCGISHAGTTYCTYQYIIGLLQHLARALFPAIENDFPSGYTTYYIYNQKNQPPAPSAPAGNTPLHTYVIQFSLNPRAPQCHAYTKDNVFPFPSPPLLPPSSAAPPSSFRFVSFPCLKIIHFALRTRVAPHPSTPANNGENTKHARYWKNNIKRK